MSVLLLSDTEDDTESKDTVAFSNMFLKIIHFDVLTVFPNYNFLSPLVAPL